MLHQSCLFTKQILTLNDTDNRRKMIHIQSNKNVRKKLVLNCSNQKIKHTAEQKEISIVQKKKTGGNIQIICIDYKVTSFTIE